MDGWLKSIQQFFNLLNPQRGPRGSHHGDPRGQQVVVYEVYSIHFPPVDLEVGSEVNRLNNINRMNSLAPG